MISSKSFAVGATIPFGSGPERAFADAEIFGLLFLWPLPRLPVRGALGQRYRPDRLAFRCPDRFERALLKPPERVRCLVGVRLSRAEGAWSVSLVGEVPQ